MWEKLLFENASELLSVGITLVVAWIKKRYDLRKLRKEGFLKDYVEIYKNGKIE